MLQKSVFLAAPDIYIYAYLKFYLVILLTGEVEAVIMRLTDTDLNLHIISPLHRATLLTSTEWYTTLHEMAWTSFRLAWSLMFCWLVFIENYLFALLCFYYWNDGSLKVEWINNDGFYPKVSVGLLTYPLPCNYNYQSQLCHIKVDQRREPGVVCVCQYKRNLCLFKQ